jgi:hypothetical protein
MYTLEHGQCKIKITPSKPIAKNILAENGKSDMCHPTNLGGKKYVPRLGVAEGCELVRRQAGGAT